MTTPILGYISLYDMIIYFFIFSFLGWIAEVIFATLKTGKFVNRGFLNGPICPIYGIGMAVAVLLLNTISEKWYLLFIVGSLLATFLEFITGFILEKIFKLKWWDYSKEHFNIKGYICLRFSILWGIAIVALFYTLVPLTNKLIGLIPFKWWGLSIICFLFLLLIIDLGCTISQLVKLKKHIDEAGKLQKILHKGSDVLGEKISDATIGVIEKLEVINKKISKSRIGKAFPKINNYFINFEEKRKEEQKEDKK